jgi:hypothetical protein
MAKLHHGDFLKRCHRPLTARTRNDPISATTTSRSENRRPVEAGENPGRRRVQGKDGKDRGYRPEEGGVNIPPTNRFVGYCLAYFNHVW